MMILPNVRLHYSLLLGCCLLQTIVDEVCSVPVFVPFDVNPFQEFYHVPTYEDIPHIPIGDPLELEFIDHMKTRPLADADFVHTGHRQFRSMVDFANSFKDRDDEGDEDDKADPMDQDEDVDAVDDDIDELTMAELFEGDIVVYTKDELRNLVHGRRAHMRSASTPPEMLWDNGLVPFIIADTFSDHERRQIGKAMEAFHDLTCIKFEPRGPDHDDFIIIYQGKGCSSGVGRRGGPQSISLASKCIKKHSYGTILHEFMHVLGFEHEQARYDRDEHVTINWDNINPTKRYNFGMRPSGPTTTLGLDYDYNSLMHYGSKFFAVNRSIDTIIPEAENVSIGNRIDFSELDLKGLNSLYRCHEKNVTTNGNKTSSEASNDEKDNASKNDGSNEVFEENNEIKWEVAMGDEDDDIYDEIIEEKKEPAHDEEIQDNQEYIISSKHKINHNHEPEISEENYVDESQENKSSENDSKNKHKHKHKHNHKHTHHHGKRDDEKIIEEELKEYKISSKHKIAPKHDLDNSGENNINGSEENKSPEGNKEHNPMHRKIYDDEIPEDENISKRKRKHKHSHKHHSKNKKRKKPKKSHKQHDNVDGDNDIHNI